MTWQGSYFFPHETGGVKKDRSHQARVSCSGERNMHDLFVRKEFFGGNFRVNDNDLGG